ncbi:MAG: exopolyphosphatase-related protein [halophilic archaeon J07HX64]|nr:MAG: exopolyphosphatase-related protein [halophilic archaeon J07HX64]
MLGYRLYRSARVTPGQRFAQVVGTPDAVAVLMHSDPDPDAMASAVAAAEIAEEQGTDATIYYPGQIQRDENRAFETVLNLQFQRIDSGEDIAEQQVVLVDHNTTRELKNDGTLAIMAVVDHHSGDGTGSQFTDVRPELGACASILSEYLNDLGRAPDDTWIDVHPDNKQNRQKLQQTREKGLLPASISTGLVYGIQTDTDNLTDGCTAADFEAVRYLYNGIDNNRLNRMANPDVDAETLELLAQAITNRDVRSPFAISDVGTVSNTDAIPQAADELERLDCVTAVVVMGDKDGVIRLAGRSSDDRIHMGKILGTLTDSIPLAGGGGHARMGGGRIPIEHMEGLGPGKGLSRAEFKEQLFKAMNGEF